MLHRLPLSVLVIFALSACESETLSREVARLKITPQPEGFQTALSDPPGMDMGQVPLHGLGIARFRLDNIGGAALEITGATVESATGGTFGVESFTDEINARNTDDGAGELVVTFSPEADALTGEGVIALQTNSGDKEKDVVRVQIRGVGLFVGAPNIEVCYGGSCYPAATDCSDRGDGKNVCVLPTLDWGNVPLETAATQEIRLRNAPLPDTCEPPPGSPECTPVCQLVFDRDATGRDLGFGFDPVDSGFSLEGNVVLPFALDVANPQCNFEDEVRLLLTFAAGASEGDHQSTMVIESNDPDATFIEIPVLAGAREAPIAVAEFIPCTIATLPNCTPDADAVRPLDRVFLTGENSYDANGETITHYTWTVEEYPPGANPTDFLTCSNDGDCHGGTCGCVDDECSCVNDPAQSNFSLWLPLAGRYVVRLHVRNNLGITSGVTDTSDIEIFAIPNSRMHIQLVWDHPTNDQDLHVTSVATGDMVCGAPGDCFWGNCKLECLQPDSDCRDAPQWFSSDPAYEGPNPRLDIDDTHGLGPENINIDAPLPDRYRLYVHYYTLVDRSDDATQSTVRIYIDGQLVAEYRRVLEPDDIWRVAEIEWFPDNSSLVMGATSDGGGQGAVKKLYSCSNPFNFGGPL